MDISPATLWQLATTLALAPLAYFIKASLERVREIEIGLAKTREEMFEKYATKTGVSDDVGRVLDRLDHLDQKLDKLLLNRG